MPRKQAGRQERGLPEGINGRVEMRIIPIIAAMVIGILLIPGACSTTRPPKTALIQVVLEYPLENWRPSAISVAAGGTVTWTNKGNSQHGVVSGEGLFETQKLWPGESFNYTFAKSGTYTYHDDPVTPIGTGTIYVE